MTSAIVVAALALVTTLVVLHNSDIVIGETSLATRKAKAGPNIPTPPSEITTTAAPAPVAGGSGGLHRGTGGGEPGNAPGLLPPNGHPYGPAINYVTDIPVPDHLVWILVVGTDARPGTDPLHTNGDSIHLLAINPKTREGTILGFPRDSWVQIPGHGTRKINSSMSLGGPKLMAETVHNLTGLPVDYWVVTGFAGFKAIVGDLGGLNVPVEKRMNDSFSGARFQPGWHNFDADQALAYSRDRHDVEDGDFTRSLHQGNVILSALARSRAEIGDDGGIRHWVDVLLRHASVNVGLDDVVRLASLGRRMDPSRLRNVVTPGRIGTASGQSVVFLGKEAANIFIDLRDDAVIGGSTAAPAESTSAPPPTEAPTTAPPTTAAPATTTTTTTSTVGIHLP